MWVSNKVRKMSDFENCHSSGSDLIAFVGCSGCAAQGHRAETFSSCSEAVANGFRRDECKSGCVGIGSCVKACPKDALKLENGGIIVDKEKASIGMLQRYLKVGFNRAARIMDQLEEAGVVGPEEGTKPRQILVSPEQFENMLEEGL